jgi:hypothetical protein
MSLQMLKGLSVEQQTRRLRLGAACLQQLARPYRSPARRAISAIRVNVRETMKIVCRCGAPIPDNVNDAPFKAHLIPDQGWDALLEAIDAAIEKSGPSAAQKEAACMAIRRHIGSLSRLAWQCPDCGSVYVDDPQYRLRELNPASADLPRNLFAARTNARRNEA